MYEKKASKDLKVQITREGLIFGATSRGKSMNQKLNFGFQIVFFLAEKEILNTLWFHLLIEEVKFEQQQGLEKFETKANTIRMGKKENENKKEETNVAPNASDKEQKEVLSQQKCFFFLKFTGLLNSPNIIK
ncbi:hypothetical protein RFI_39677 [Reticulomyxa filosa]|uniref:Uncharacterized protein n=1 Tax=Reticulomyxa filosa TaxID=46433 RepID=X6LAV4_RETFI|nr:hypothetical protein RFI_39677 [Reticulomyxa filosa]|eukprot:ETN97849.1 hypothetical protein RFI_39677 [Reticulomyxa filosa]